MHYIATLLRRVDIEVDLERTLQALEDRAAAVESLGSLELPHGRPSPSDGPSRQDDIARPNLPSFVSPPFGRLLNIFCRLGEELHCLILRILCHASYLQDFASDYPAMADACNRL